MSIGEYPLVLITEWIYSFIYSDVYFINDSLSTISSQAKQSLSIDQWNDSTSLSAVQWPGIFNLCFLKFSSTNLVNVDLSGSLPLVFNNRFVFSKPLFLYENYK